MNKNYFLERYEQKIYLYLNGVIVMILEDLGQTDETIINSYETVIFRFSMNNEKSNHVLL